MVQVCIRCQKLIGDLLEDSRDLSKKLCLSCQKLLDNEEISINDIIDYFEFPIVILNQKHSVLNTNQAAEKMLGRFNLGKQEERIGNLLQCPNAKLEGGCGKSVQCGKCLIRNAISHTYQTGIIHDHIKTTLIRSTSEGTKKDIPITLGIQKMGTGIMVHIIE